MMETECVKDKRILYFSDGELNLDEIEHNEPTVTDAVQPQLNPKELNWGSWMWYQSSVAGSKALEVCDYLGEGLASFFGITTPKYQFEINEYHRMKKAEEEAQKEKDLEMGGWIQGNQENIKTVAPSNFQGNETNIRGD